MDIREEIQKRRQLQSNNIYKSFSGTESITEGEESIEKAREIDELEKGEIMDAVSSYEGKIKITKTGKEIKDQVNSVLKPSLEAKLIETEKNCDELLSQCGKEPSQPVCSYWTSNGATECPFKVYSWSETNFRVENDENVSLASSLSAYEEKDEPKKKINLPATAEEAAARNAYNDAVRSYCDISVDLKACEILNMISDKEKYELSPRQVISFKF